MERTFIAMIAAQAPITALIGSGADCRLYPSVMPQNPTFPALVYQLVSGPRDYTQDGPDGVTTFRMQLVCYSPDHAQVVALRDAIEATLSGLYNQSFGSPAVKVQGCFIAAERDGFDPELGEAGPALYPKIIDLMVTLAT